MSMQFASHSVSLQLPFNYKCNTDTHAKILNSENSSACNKPSRWLVFRGIQLDVHLEITENVNGSLNECLQDKWSP